MFSNSEIFSGTIFFLIHSTQYVVPVPVGNYTGIFFPKIISPTEQVEDAINSQGQGAGNSKQFRLIPSKQAMKDAAEMKMEVLDGDIPLLVADKLAFQGSKGVQVPLFLEKADAITGYNRLREASGASTRLPLQPTIRSTTLFDELTSMEIGTRPSVSQLAFYGTADDLLRADALIQ